ncbi:hypothetical protein LMG28138_01773 [Pararobbsia alpina]|uniref:Uncharacterized protein n=1 Tax=Pararobbsia alpina TaxID=621374 RepID=A0A6S7BAA8_9BURK|nr:hypothetical protein LMG28138_01773 [Pararobbsia alpina]
MQINVQFEDSTDQTIQSVFASPQDPKVWANLGLVDTSDALWETYYNAQSVTVQQYLLAPT